MLIGILRDNYGYYLIITAVILTCLIIAIELFTTRKLGEIKGSLIAIAIALASVFIVSFILKDSELFNSNRSSNNILKFFVKTFALIYGTSSIMMCAISDFKHGEIHRFEMILAESGLVGLPVLYGFTLGCSCIAKYNLIAFVIFVVIVLLDAKFNNEKHVGSADIDMLSAVLLGLLSVCFAISKKSASYDIALMKMLAIGTDFVDFSFVSMVTFYAIGKIRNRIHRKKLDIKADSAEEQEDKTDDIDYSTRAIPMFVLPYVYILFLLYSQ